ncbi:hypothetical protein PAPYR_2874 [Paratrimastix pyriformis]|uniref:Uncharacterized protein n=1 Tax=Paratrimastix pyriformis TaxID=342808 RepID=A0ABQ8UQD7_9EUKA|nr:hypothetical protein PAPYR_2874 [Paratrimastix pyriformis]
MTALSCSCGGRMHCSLENEKTVSACLFLLFIVMVLPRTQGCCCTEFERQGKGDFPRMHPCTSKLLCGSNSRLPGASTHNNDEPPQPERGWVAQFWYIFVVGGCLVLVSLVLVCLFCGCVSCDCRRRRLTGRKAHVPAPLNSWAPSSGDALVTIAVTPTSLSAPVVDLPPPSERQLPLGCPIDAWGSGTCKASATPLDGPAEEMLAVTSPPVAPSPPLSSSPLLPVSAGAPVEPPEQPPTAAVVLNS